MNLNNNQSSKMVAARARRDDAMRAATETFDREINAILAEGLPAQPAPPEGNRFGQVAVRTQDLTNDEMIRNIMRRLKTYNNQYYHLQ